VYLALSGDFEAVARIASLEAVQDWTKAGLMARQSPEAFSSYAFSFATPTQVSCFQWRQTARSRSMPEGDGTPFSALPLYLKLVRKGNDFFSFRSKDGQEWEENHTIDAPNAASIAMKDPILVGLAATSHFSGMLATAVFDSFTVNGRSPLSAGEMNTADGFNALAVSQKGKFVLTMEIAETSGETPLKEIHITLPAEFQPSGARVVGDVQFAGQTIAAKSVQDGPILKVTLEKAITTSGRINAGLEAVAGAAETSSVTFAVQLLSAEGRVLIDKLNGGNVNDNPSDLNGFEGIGIVSDAPVTPPAKVNAEPVAGENDVRVTWSIGDERTGEPPKAHVEIMKADGTLVHQGDDDLSKFRFG